MEELIIKDSAELRGIVAGFLKRLSSEKHQPPKKEVDSIKSAQIQIERLKKEGKIAPDAKITIITEAEPLTPEERREKDLIFEKIMENPAVVDAYINYLKREDHIEPFVSKVVELMIDSMELTPEDKRIGRELLSRLIIAILRKIFSLKIDLRPDMRDGHIALINKAIEYAKKKGMPPQEVFESDQYFKEFTRMRGVEGF